MMLQSLAIPRSRKFDNPVELEACPNEVANSTFVPKYSFPLARAQRPHLEARARLTRQRVALEKKDDCRGAPAVQTVRKPISSNVFGTRTVFTGSPPSPPRSRPPEPASPSRGFHQHSKSGHTVSFPANKRWTVYLRGQQLISGASVRRRIVMSAAITISTGC